MPGTPHPLCKRLDYETFGKLTKIARLLNVFVGSAPVLFEPDAVGMVDVEVAEEETWGQIATILREEALDESDLAASEAILAATDPYAGLRKTVLDPADVDPPLEPSLRPEPAPFDPPLRRLEHFASEAVEAYLGSYNEFDPANDSHQGCLADEVESQVPVMRTDLFQLVLDDNRVGGLSSPHEASDAETYLRDAIVDFVANRAAQLAKERTS